MTPRDCQQLNITPQQMRWWSQREAPLGMTPEQYRDFKTRLRVEMRGDIDYATLTILRTALHLDDQGRLSDDWDQEFGCRELRSEEEFEAWMTLWRHSPSEWSVSVATAIALEPDEIASLRDEILEAARRAGLDAVQTFPHG